MSEQSELLKERTISFAVNVLRLVDRLPRTSGSDVIARQLAKCATSIGANYRAVCNARSRAEFIARLGVAVEEAEESTYWLDILLRVRIIPGSQVPTLRQEAIELRSIFSRSAGTARLNARTK